jgi:hypothetical protein
MKRLLTLLLLCVTIGSTEAFAQIKFGIKGGMNLTSISFEENFYSKKNQPGFFIGPTVKFTLPLTGLAIDASALYDQRSQKAMSSDLVGTPFYYTSIKQQQIVVPVNLRYQFGLGSTLGIYVFAGPQIGFNLNNDFTELDYGDWRPEKTSLSANLGLGAMLLKHLEISASYNLALTQSANITINDNKRVVNEGKMNAWQIALGWYF